MRESKFRIYGFHYIVPGNEYGKLKIGDKDFRMELVSQLQFISGSIYAWGGMFSGRLVVDIPKEKLSESELILMQFVGLKDKSNKEIYEGDILKYEESGQFAAKSIYIVEFIRGAFISVDIEENEYSEHIDDFGANTREIIGNIYENPELLKESLTNKKV